MTEQDTRGFLTDDDRDYLNGEKDLTEGSEFNVRRRIRERAEQGFRDFALLHNRINPDDREKLFQQEGGGARVFQDVGFRESVRDTLAFVFVGTGTSYAYISGAEVPLGEPWVTLLADMVSTEGVRRGYHVTNVDFEVDSERVRLDRAREKLEENPEELEAAEMKVLVEEGEADLVPAPERRG